MKGDFKIVVEGSGTFQTGAPFDADAIGRQLVAALLGNGQTVNSAVLQIVETVDIDLTQPVGQAPTPSAPRIP